MTAIFERQQHLQKLNKAKRNTQRTKKWVKVLSSEVHQIYFKLRLITHVDGSRVSIALIRLCDSVYLSVILSAR